MTYRSTVGRTSGRTFEDVVIEGAAADGGLYLPADLPTYEFPSEGSPHAAYVTRSLEAFGATDIDGLVEDAFASFNHPEVAPITEIQGHLTLELFWGPTLSFKDHALQVLGRLFNRYASERGEERTVLVATSGDTGSAAIAGFRGLGSVRIVVLFPAGMVTDFQRRQMTTVADANVTVLSVDGNFDDCQRMVKEAFRSQPGLASANSINWGRIAAQVGYYMSAAARMGGPFEVVVPTGNFGNAYSAWLARRLGAPIERIIVATNANRVLYDLWHKGEVVPSQVAATLAPAMDIQVPSNLERFLDERPADEFADEFDAGWADDETILGTIRHVHDRHGALIDPHTAVAWSVSEQLGESDLPRLIVSTAHPAKFAETIERAIGITPEVPEWGRIDSSAAERHVEIEPTLAALQPHL